MAEHNGAAHHGAIQEADRAHDDGADDDDSGRDDRDRGNGHRPVRFPVDSQVLADPGGTRLMSEGHPAFPRPRKPERHFVRWIVIAVIVAAIVGAGLYWGLPRLRYELETVSTDDAFVASHITYASPRVEGLITEVMVDQDDRVEPGQLLAKLDREPFAVAVAQAEASLEEAQGQRRAGAGAGEGPDRAGPGQLVSPQERPGTAAPAGRGPAGPGRHPEGESVEAMAGRAGSAADRQPGQAGLGDAIGAGPAEQHPQGGRREREGGLGGHPGDRAPPSASPRTTRTPSISRRTWRSSSRSSRRPYPTSRPRLAQIGIPFNPKDAAQARAFEDFLRPRGDKSAGEGLEMVVEQAPAVRVALAAAARAEKQLDDARLRLRWTEVRSEIAGYVQDRQANPGNRVEPGQTLLSIRPTYVWIDANYKETQIHDIRIGMPVDIYVDAYPHRVFRGRVAGFSPGTGLSESLLPPENATGNYVKVTQRLPVRIELTEPNPDDTPLFAGLSVVPHVRMKEPTTGPGAGGRLHTYGRLRPPDVGGGPAGTQPRNRARD